MVADSRINYLLGIFFSLILWKERIRESDGDIGDVRREAFGG
jgi:hypothetical protein